MLESRSTTSKLLLLATLYISQGLPYGFFTQALPVILREQGVSLPAIGFSSLLALPWALKFLWAPYVDGYSGRFHNLGRRRGWILLLQSLAIVCLLLLSLAHPSEYMGLLLTGILCLNVFAATQDIASDGLAVEMLDRGERGLGNGVQVAGYRVGMIVGGGAILIVFPALGWSNSMLLMALLLLAATVPIGMYREENRGTDNSVSEPRGMAVWWGFCQQEGIGSWLLVLLLYKSADAFAGAMLRPFLIDSGLEMSDIGWLLGTVGFSAGLLGALAGGWGVNRLGRSRALIGFGILQTMTLGTYLLPVYNIGGTPLLITIIALEHFVGGMATVALFTMMMDKCRTYTEGSDYSIQASLVVVATGSSAALSGISAASIGYAGHFGLSVILGAAVMIWVIGAHRTGRLSVAQR